MTSLLGTKSGWKRREGEDGGEIDMSLPLSRSEGGGGVEDPRLLHKIGELTSLLRCKEVGGVE